MGQQIYSQATFEGESIKTQALFLINAFDRGSTPVMTSIIKKIHLQGASLKDKTPLSELQLRPGEFLVSVLPSENYNLLSCVVFTAGRNPVNPCCRLHWRPRKHVSQDQPRQKASQRASLLRPVLQLLRLRLQQPQPDPMCL